MTKDYYGKCGSAFIRIRDSLYPCVFHEFQVQPQRIQRKGR